MHENASTALPPAAGGAPQPRPICRAAPLGHEPRGAFRAQGRRAHDTAAEDGPDEREGAPRAARRAAPRGAARVLQRFVRRERPGDVRQEDPDGHRELRDGPERAAERRRRRLGDVDGHRDGRRADAGAQQHARAYEGPRAVGPGRRRPRLRGPQTSGAPRKSLLLDGVENNRTHGLLSARVHATT